MRLVEALRERAVVMWRTHADTMPDEAAALSVLALADLHDAAEQAGVPWTLLLDEFGAVIKMAAQRGVGDPAARPLPRRAGASWSTQSAADVDALTGQPGLLASLTDNFAGVVAHRQTVSRVTRLACEADGHPRALANDQPDQRPRDALTRAAAAPGGYASSAFRPTPSARSARGEAVIYTPIAGEPTRGSVLAVKMAATPPARIDLSGPRATCEARVHPSPMLHPGCPAAAEKPTGPAAKL